MQQMLATASLVGSLVLVLVTVWYAWQTQQMVREMRTARIASLRPEIRLDLGLIAGTAFVEVENVGVGPAIDVDVALAAANRDGDMESQRWTAPLLKSGERRTMLMPNKDSLGSLMQLTELAELDAKVVMTGTCRDLDGREHPVRSTLSFAAHGDRGPEGEFTGVDERWPQNLEKAAKALDGIRRFLESTENPWRGA